MRSVEHTVRRAAPTAHVRGRLKTPSSTSAKAQRLGVDVCRVLDRLGVRVIVDTVRDCYRVSDSLHMAFSHVQAEYDDYIFLPKVNGYQGLHSILLDRLGRPFEVQVRTRAMHVNAESGEAAHADYKEAQSSRWSSPIDGEPQ